MRAHERRAHRGRRPPRAACRRTIASRCASRPRPPVPAPRASRSAACAGRVRRRRRSSRCRSGRRPRPRRSRPTARSTRARSPAGARRRRASSREFGGLEITTSSTALQALTDAVLYLVAYPFECAEQLASRVLGDRGAARTCSPRSRPRACPQPDELEAARGPRPRAAGGACRTTTAASRSGAAATSRGRTSRIHVAHALERAKAKGFAVPDAHARARAARTCKNIERHIPKDYPDDVRRTLMAYALYVRARMGDRDAGARARARARGRRREAARSKRSAGCCRSCPATRARAAEVAAIRRHLANRVTETAATAHFATSLRRQARTCCCTRTAARTPSCSRR